MSDEPREWRCIECGALRPKEPHREHGMVSVVKPKQVGPTDKQLNYAEILVERLRREGHVKAAHYERAVESCQSKQEMTRLISEMVEIKEDLDV